MPVSSAHLYSQLDSQDAAKQLQTEWGVAMLLAHFSPYQHALGERAQCSRCSEAKLSSASCAKKKKKSKKCLHNLPTDFRSISQANVMTRFTIFQVVAINLKSMHICVCHILCFTLYSQ